MKKLPKFDVKFYVSSFFFFLWLLTSEIKFRNVAKSYLCEMRLKSVLKYSWFEWIKINYLKYIFDKQYCFN